MRYMATNKKTRVKYGPFDQAYKDAVESTPETAGIFSWEPVQEIKLAPRPELVKPAPAVEPIAAKPQAKGARKRKKSE